MPYAVGLSARFQRLASPTTRALRPGRGVQLRSTPTHAADEQMPLRGRGNQNANRRKGARVLHPRMRTHSQGLHRGSVRDQVREGRPQRDVHTNRAVQKIRSRHLCVDNRGNEAKINQIKVNRTSSSRLFFTFLPFSRPRRRSPLDKLSQFNISFFTQQTEINGNETRWNVINYQS